MNIAIIGAYGFIGTNLTEELSSKHKIISCGRGDDLDTAVSESDMVIILSPNIEDIINSMHKTGVRRVIYLSSGGCVYGKYKGKPFEVGDIEVPTNEYGIKKLNDENIIKESNLKYAILRPSNVYGEHHKNEWTGLPNMCIKKALRGELLTLFGNFEKDYIYVKDLCKIISYIIDKDITGTYNVGSGYVYSSKEIISIISKYLNVKIENRKGNNNDTGYRIKTDFDIKYHMFEDVVETIIEDEKKSSVLNC